MNQIPFKFIPEQWVTESNEPILRIIYPGELDAIKGNVLEESRDLTDVELNRLSYVLHDDTDIRASMDCLLIEALEIVFDPEENWSEIDKDFRLEQIKENNQQNLYDRN